MNPRHSPRPMPKAVFVSLVCGKAKEKAELFCKERLWVYNYVMKTTKNYTERPKEDPVTTRQMFKIVIYAAMNHIYSSRDIETA